MSTLWEGSIKRRFTMMAMTGSDAIPMIAASILWPRRDKWVHSEQA
jgi:hypothetical protein